MISLTALKTAADLAKRNTAVEIIPRFEDGDYLLCREFRFAVNDYVWEFPTGVIDGDETPEQAAARELTVQTEALLQKLCAAGCDPLRFGERLYRKQPELWLETASQSWPELLKTARWQVDTACRLDKG